MAATSEPTRLVPGTVSFELERFERSDGRLQLSGRWFGVRGMRFVRPTLTLALGDGTSSRALADLEHKPWAPLDGETWEAAFPWGDDALVLDAELAVAPGIAVPLPAPGEELPDAEPIAALPTDGAPAPRKRGAPQPRRGRAAPTSDVPDEIAVLHEETQRLRQEPIRLQAELDRSEQLRQDVEDELERLKMDADGAVARRDQAVGRFEDATTERDEAIRMRDVAVRAQNEAARERNEANRARDEAIGARDSALAERKAALAERDAALRARDSAAAERDGALKARDDALAERDKAVAERDAATSRCEQATAERLRAMAERDKAVSERDRARAQRTTTLAARSVAPVRSTPLVPQLADDQDQLVKRAIAIGLLLVAGIALLIIVGVL